MFASGHVLSGKFALEHPLAHGGMGSVWAGRHLALDTPVAIKFFAEALASSDAARLRFEREARAAARLRSPHVVQIIDFGLEAGAPYIVLELLDGEDLRARLDRVGLLSLRETAAIVSQVAQGLSLAHDAGLVHLDMKPSNVFLARIGEEEVVKLLEFGVARRLDPRVAGDTSVYMSPEQARGDSFDQRSDQWSLAVVAFEALTGARPFAGGDVIARICAGTLPVASDYAPDLPAAIDAFFSRALSRDPDGRFSTVRELADALARIAHDSGADVVRLPPSPASSGRPRPPATLGGGERFGRYMLYDEIGAGGMASVHIGRLLGPAGFGRTVAIKRMRGELVRDPELLAMFLDEARLAARIQHRNVVQVLDVVPAGHEVLLAMEYVKGDSLARLLRSRSAVPEAVVLALASDMLHGLHAAHEATAETGEHLSIVHRDVSPQNILVGADGVARVTDFGIAKAAVRVHSTRDGHLKGKLGYMAPEQVRRGRLDRRTDVFAASVVIWEMLTGERLFAGDNPGAILHQILHDAVPPPTSKVPSVSPAVSAIVMKGLERSPDARFATALEMATALEALGPARAADVASWVEATIGGVLRERAARVQAIESASVAAADAVGDDTDALSAAVAVPRPGPRAADVPTSPIPPHAAPQAESGSRAALGDLASVREIDATTRSTLAAEHARRSRRRSVIVVCGAVAAGAAVFLVWPHGGGIANQAASHAEGPASARVAPVPSPAEPPEEPSVAPLSASAIGASSPPGSPPRASPRALPRAKPRPSCDPPYVIDARGVRVYKRECLDR